MTLASYSPGSEANGWQWQQKAAGRIRLVSDSSVFGGSWAECECRAGDTLVAGSKTNARCELNRDPGQNNFLLGSDVYYAWSHRGVSGAALQFGGVFGFLFQVHAANGNGGQAQVALHTQGGNLCFRIWDCATNREHATWRVRSASGALRTYTDGTVYEFVMRLKTEDDNTGRITIWCDGVLVGDAPAIQTIFSVYPGGANRGATIPVGDRENVVKHGDYTDLLSGSQTRVVRNGGFRASRGTGYGLAEAAANFNNTGWGTGGGGGGTTDTTGPTLTVSHPTTGAVVSGDLVPVFAVNDVSGVASVSVSRGGVVVATSSVSPFPLVIDTTAFSEGTNVLTFRATDTVGNVTTLTRSIEVENGSDVAGLWTAPSFWDYELPVGELPGLWTPDSVFDIGVPGQPGVWTDDSTFTVILQTVLPPSRPALTTAWAFEAVSRAGVPLAGLSPESFKLTRRLKAASEAVFTLRPESVGSSSVDHTCILRAWRNPTPAETSVATLRFAGQVLQTTDVGKGDGAEVTDVRCLDPFAALAERYITEDLVYTEADQGAIIDELVTAQNGRENTHLALGAYDPSVVRDRTYERGKSVGEAVSELSDVDGGPYFVVDATDAGATVGLLTLRHPDSGSDLRGTVRFEYGQGTVANVAEIQVATDPPVNASLAVGAATEDVTLVATATDTGSVTEYGLRERFVARSDVSEPVTLDGHATAALYPAPLQTYRLTPGVVPQVPRLFDDFDVGDLVTLYSRGRSPRLQFEVVVRVTEATVSVDANGVEILDSVTVEVVEAVA